VKAIPNVKLVPSGFLAKYACMCFVLPLSKLRFEARRNGGTVVIRPAADHSVAAKVDTIDRRPGDRAPRNVPDDAASTKSTSPRAHQRTARNLKSGMVESATEIELGIS
jgi:hypothetical protein